MQIKLSVKRQIDDSLFDTNTDRPPKCTQRGDGAEANKPDVIKTVLCIL